jgi:hypothetical protein
LSEKVEENVIISFGFLTKRRTFAAELNKKIAILGKKIAK